MKLQQLYSYVRQAIDDYQMIADGDRIAVGISGGKDSLTLLYALSGLRRFYPKKTKLGNILNGPWMVSESEFDRMDKAGEIYWTENGDGQPYGKIYLSESKGQIPNDFWGIEFGTNQRGS